MGRNFISVCHECQVTLMHLRGHESDHMQQFANDHSAHEKHTEVYDNYVDEPPERYRDVFDEYNPDWEKKMKSAEEGVCQICRIDYPVWFAPSELWNKVMRPEDGYERYAFVCLDCFAKEAERIGIRPTAWVLTEEELGLKRGETAPTKDT